MNRKKTRKAIKLRNKKLLLTIALAVLLAAAALVFLLARDALERESYRLDYPELVQECSGKYDLDPYLVASVIHVESSNRASVSSSAGAVGLMQIMPETGEWLAGKLDIEAYSAEMLTDPAVNVEMGCWFLNYLLDRYDGDTVAALSAYNAGPTHADEWLADPEYSPDGKTLYPEKIPFEQTRQYVERIQRSYEKYKELYTLSPIGA